MHLTVRNVAASLLLALGGATALAEPAAPVGLWKTVDDETRTEKSLVRIGADAAGMLTGRVEKLLDPARAGAVCDKCTGELHGRPIVGLTILSGVTKAEGGAGEPAWDGGRILDPNNGKSYKVRLRPVADGTKLEVRGYLGPFYRTQVWLRAD